MPFLSSPVRLPNPGLLAWLGVAVCVGLLGGLGWSPPPAAPAPPALLPSVWAIPVRVDTQYVGGYAEGSFQRAMGVLASDLSHAERAMVGRHLDKMFLPLLSEGGLGRSGRLRLVYERVLRPDGTARSIRVLAAEAAVGGTLHTAFLFDDASSPGYYDERGESLEGAAWAAPLERMEVTSPFSTRRLHPVLRRVLPHTGIDYAGSFGDPVHAAADGIIVFARDRGGYGNMVEVQHPNGYATRYAHLSGFAVREQEVVSRGDVIGFVGSTGLSTGPHLHYEVRRLGRAVDPAVVDLASGASTVIRYSPAWSTERRALSGLLARAPTLLSVRR